MDRTIVWMHETFIYSSLYIKELRGSVSVRVLILGLTRHSRWSQRFSMRFKSKKFADQFICDFSWMFTMLQKHICIPVDNCHPEILHERCYVLPLHKMQKAKHSCKSISSPRREVPCPRGWKSLKTSRTLPCSSTVTIRVVDDARKDEQHSHTGINTIRRIKLHVSSY